MRYEIKGDTLPVVIINLESGESIITQGGGMAWMSPNMHMETTSRGGIGKLLGRALAGDTLFQNIYTAENGNGVIAVASSFPERSVNSRSHRKNPLSCRNPHSSARIEGWSCLCSLRKILEPACLVEKDSSCRRSPVPEPALLNLTALSWNMN